MGGKKKKLCPIDSNPCHDVSRGQTTWKFCDNIHMIDPLVLESNWKEKRNL